MVVAREPVTDICFLPAGIKDIFFISNINHGSIVTDITYFSLRTLDALTKRHTFYYLFYILTR